MKDIEEELKELEEECQHEDKYYYAGVMKALGTIKDIEIKKSVKFRLFNNQYENVYRCDGCSADFHSYTKIDYKYCPYCGSKVIGIKLDYKCIAPWKVTDYLFKKIKEKVMLRGGAEKDIWRDHKGYVYVNEPYASQIQKSIDIMIKEELKQYKWKKH